MEMNVWKFHFIIVAKAIIVSPKSNWTERERVKVKESDSKQMSVNWKTHSIPHAAIVIKCIRRADNFLYRNNNEMIRMK